MAAVLSFDMGKSWTISEFAQFNRRPFLRFNSCRLRYISRIHWSSTARSITPIPIQDLFVYVGRWNFQGWSVLLRIGICINKYLTLQWTLVRCITPISNDATWWWICTIQVGCTMIDHGHCRIEGGIGVPYRTARWTPAASYTQGGFTTGGAANGAPDDATCSATKDTGSY